MLNRRALLGSGAGYPARQNGVVLFIALIVLVAMTLAGIALMRSVDTTTVIAGNIAFQQSATHSGDGGVEAAVTWLQAQNTGNNLWASQANQGYSATRSDPAPNVTWDTYWNNVLSGQSFTVGTDASGNTISYAIQRLCNATGDPSAPGTGCAVSIVSSTSQSSSSQGANEVGLLYSSQIYYRITVRIAGPRNTVSYVQSIVSL